MRIVDETGRGVEGVELQLVHLDADSRTGLGQAAADGFQPPEPVHEIARLIASEDSRARLLSAATPEELVTRLREVGAGLVTTDA